MPGAYQLLNPLSLSVGNRNPVLSLCPLLSLSFVTEAGIGLGFMNGAQLIENISVGKVSCCKNSTSDREGGYGNRLLGAEGQS